MENLDDKTDFVTEDANLNKNMTKTKVTEVYQCTIT